MNNDGVFQNISKMVKGQIFTVFQFMVHFFLVIIKSTLISRNFGSQVQIRVLSLLQTCGGLLSTLWDNTELTLCDFSIYLLRR